MHQLLALLLASLTAASPLFSRADLPPSSKSKAFNLVVNVTEPDRDFFPSIHGEYINSIHVGAGQSLLGVGGKSTNPLTFYINGTALEFHFARSTVVSDIGTPLSPWGVFFTNDEGSDMAHTAHLDGGPGAKGIGLTRPPVPYTFMYPETYAICNETVPYYKKKFLIVKQFDLGLKLTNAIPPNCVPVRLVAQCTKLDPLPEGSFSNHDFAYETSCYKDVAAIDWAKYQPW